MQTKTRRKGSSEGARIYPDEWRRAQKKWCRPAAYMGTEAAKAGAIKAEERALGLSGEGKKR